MNIEPIKLWIDRQLAGLAPRIIGDPSTDKIQVLETDDGLVAICKAGCFLIDGQGNGQGNAQECDLETDGSA